MILCARGETRLSDTCFWITLLLRYDHNSGSLVFCNPLPLLMWKSANKHVTYQCLVFVFFADMLTAHILSRSLGRVCIVLSCQHNWSTMCRPSSFISVDAHSNIAVVTVGASVSSLFTAHDMKYPCSCSLISSALLFLSAEPANEPRVRFHFHN